MYLFFFALSLFLTKKPWLYDLRQYDPKYINFITYTKLLIIRKLMTGTNQPFLHRIPFTLYEFGTSIQHAFTNDRNDI